MIIDLTLSSKANMYKHSGSTRRQVVNGLLVIGEYFSIDVHGFAVHTLINYLNQLNNKILTKTRVNEDQTKDPTRSNIKRA